MLLVEPPQRLPAMGLDLAGQCVAYWPGAFHLAPHAGRNLQLGRKELVQPLCR